MAAQASTSSGKSMDSEDVSDEPLDKQKLEVNKDGRKIMVPAIHIGFMEPRRFIPYKPLVSFSASESGNETLTVEEEEWLERMSFLEDDFHWLLQLPYQRFWSQIAFDEGLQRCLESYLMHAPREYDLAANPKESLFSVLQKVHKLVFLVFLRMSTYKESKIHYMTPSGFGEIIYENFIFDIPKMMDICVLYGRGNDVLLKKMISNIFNAQPFYTADLEAVVPNLLLVFDNVEAKLGLHSMSDEENRRPKKLGEGQSSSINSMPLSSLVDVAYYITDSSITLNSFLEIYPLACNILYKSGFPTRIALFYNKVFPAIENEIIIRRRKEEEPLPIFEGTINKLGLAKTHLVQMFRNFISVSCIQPIIESRWESVNGFSVSQASHLEEFMQIFTEVVSEKHFIQDYNHLFPFDADVEMLSEADISLDATRLDYIFNSIHQNVDDDKNDSLPTSNVASHSLKNGQFHNGLEPKPVKNLQDIASALADMSVKTKNGDSDSIDEGASTSGCSVSDLQMDSLIQSVADVLPIYGAGFIEECLKYYEFSDEKVIDALLKSDLPPSLSKLDPNLQRNTIKNDITDVETNAPPTLLSQRNNIYDYDEFDIFNRTDVDLERIHQGKKDKTPQTYGGLKDSSNVELSVLKEIALSHSVVENIYFAEPDMYEDEYDDTYDSVTISLEERQTERELQSLRPFTTPRVLEQSKRRDREIEEAPHEFEEVDEVKPPQGRDEFIVNPEVIRERAEQRRQEKAAARGQRFPAARSRGGDAAEGSDKQAHDRQKKDRNKNRVANHNRKSQSDWKRSKGMGALPSR